MSSEQFGLVAVLMGGTTLEREVSLSSGNSVYKALIRKGINAVKIDWNSEINIVESILNVNPDRVFIALHGRGGEDGNIQAILNLLQIPYTGSGVQASSMMMDKVITKKILMANRLKTPKFAIMPRGYSAKQILNTLTLPLIVKPIADGSSNGVSIVNCNDDLHSAWEYANSCGSGVFVEEMIAGSEISVSILDGMTLPSIKIINQGDFYDYSAKYKDHSSQYVIPGSDISNIEDNIQHDSKKVYSAANCRGWGRVDGILSHNNEFYIFDVNTVPGLTETSLVPMAASNIGLNFDNVIVEILSRARID